MLRCDVCCEACWLAVKVNRVPFGPLSRDLFQNGRGSTIGIGSPFA
jgi:hypothetical protein